MKTNEPLAWLACLPLVAALTTLHAQETAVVKDNRVNVRGQPSLVGEVITQLQKGEKVVVLEQITVAKPKTNEPPVWARIQMPTNTPVWIYAPLLDANSKTVKVPRLNLRAGPGENYSVVGRLTKGTAVNEIRKVEDWMEIETPPGAYGFVAANLLTKPEAGSAPALASQEPPKPNPLAAPPQEQPKSDTVAKNTEPPPSQPAVVTPPPSEPAPAPKPAEPSTPETTQAAPAPATAKAEPPPAPTAAAPTPATAATTTVVPPPAPTASTAKPEEKLERRIVRREGLVRSTTSIQAPTYYELLNPDNRKTINYLHTEGIDVNLKDYRGRRIIVTGEEEIDPRWPKTPVIEVQTLELIP
jgi:SH3-like domain-containing protein